MLFDYLIIVISLKFAEIANVEVWKQIKNSNFQISKFQTGWAHTCFTFAKSDAHISNDNISHDVRRLLLISLKHFGIIKCINTRCRGFKNQDILEF